MTVRVRKLHTFNGSAYEKINARDSNKNKKAKVLVNPQETLVTVEYKAKCNASDYLCSLRREFGKQKISMIILKNPPTAY